MVNEIIKLSELSDDIEVSYDDSHTVWSVKKLKRDLKNDTYLHTKVWHTIERHEWNPCAKYMIESYIENEYQEMYDSWNEKAMDCITDDVTNKVQAILNDAFKEDTVKNYWSLEKQIEIDL